ncbi:UbiA family prenyltransferase [Candidatus Micrarchaeota archaeon]|nr:UbiA family prenyltransferase [Candidatus Micrarchaeota archaeon]
MKVFTRELFLHSRLFYNLLLLFPAVLAIVLNKLYSLESLFLFIALVLVYLSITLVNAHYDGDDDNLLFLPEKTSVLPSFLKSGVYLFIASSIISLIIKPEFFLLVLSFFVVGFFYSWPIVRWKARPIIGWLLVVIGYGVIGYFALIPFESWFLLENFFAAIFCASFFASFFVLSQIHQIDSDAKNGDKTMAVLLGFNGSKAFASFSLLPSFFAVILLTTLLGKYLALIWGIVSVFYALIFLLKIENNSSLKKTLETQFTIAGFGFIVWLGLLL